MMEMERAIESVAESSVIFESSAQETSDSIEVMIINIKQITSSLEQLSVSSEEIRLVGLQSEYDRQGDRAPCNGVCGAFGNGLE